MNEEGKRGTSLLVAYLDETYFKGREHALVALVLPAERIGELEGKLDSIVDKAHRQHNTPEDVELHGYELSGGEGQWEGIPPRARVRIYHDAIESIASIEGAAICHGSVDLEKKAPGDAHRWALTFALEQINDFAASQNRKVIGICDDVGNKSTYQEMYARARRVGTSGRYGSRLPAFSDGLHFTPSRYSRLVQAVDLVAYVYRRSQFLPFRDVRANKAMAEMFSTLGPLWEQGRHRKW